MKERTHNSDHQGELVGELGAGLLNYFKLHCDERAVVPLGLFQLHVQLEDRLQTVLVVTGEGMLPIWFTVYDGIGCHDALNLEGYFETLWGLLPAPE